MIGPEHHSFNVKHSSNLSRTKFIAIAVLLVAVSIVIMHFAINPGCNAFGCEVAGYNSLIFGRKHIEIGPSKQSTSVAKILDNMSFKPGPAPLALQQGAASISPDLGIQAKAFINSYWAFWSQPNINALSYIDSSVGSSLTFYGKLMTHRDYMIVETKFALRWPTRTYTTEPGSLIVLCETAANSCDVSGIVDWNDSSISRNESSIGSANFHFRLASQNVDGTHRFVVIEQSGSVINRRTATLN